VLDFIYTGWNGDLSEGDGGYVDTEKVRLTFGIPVPLFAPTIEFSPLSAGAFIGEEAPPPPPSQEGTSTEETTGTTTEEIPPEPIPVVETGGNEGGGAPAGEEIPPPPAVIEEPTGELPPEEVVDPIPPDVVEEPEVIVEPVIETGGTEGGGTPVGEPAL
jgi:hypothetical protein